MKQLITLSLLCILATGCSKKSDTPVAPKQPAPVTGTPGTVTINGATYATISIGSQTWTAQNYNGPGGNQYNPDSQDAADIGSFYLATTFDLPTGWRLPSVADFNKLLANFSNQKDTQGNVVCDLATTEKLLSTTGWTNITGSNSSGLNIYPAGDVFFDASKKTFNFEDQGTAAVLLTSDNSPAPDGEYLYLVLIRQPPTEGNSTTPYYTTLGEINNNSAVTNYASVRFVKDN